MSDLQEMSIPKKEQPRTTLKKAEYLKALEKSLGIKSTACKKIGIDMVTVSRWIEKDPKFAKAVADIDERVLDFGESALMKRIDAGETAAIIFFLKTKGKRRGYTERTEITGADGKDLFSQKTDEELLATIAEMQKKLQS